VAALSRWPTKAHAAHVLCAWQELTKLRLALLLKIEYAQSAQLAQRVQVEQPSQPVSTELTIRLAIRAHAHHAMLFALPPHMKHRLALPLKTGSAHSALQAQRAQEAQ
jgi:hypothetical protein